MSELLKKDLTMKILSVLIAIILWFLILDNANPYTTKPLSVPLKIINEETLQDKNIINKIKDYPRVIEVSVKGREDEIKNISENDFEATLDFAKVTSADMTHLKIDGPRYIGKSNISEVTYSASPKEVILNLEAIDKNVFHVEIKTTGSLKDKYKIISSSASPETVALQGMDSLIKSVGSVKVVSDVSGLDRDKTEKVSCKVYDKTGKEIPQLSKNLIVEVKIAVAKEVKVKPNVKGKPAPNYIDTSSGTSPQTVLITGLPEILSKIDLLSTEPVSIEHATETLIAPTEIILPAGVKLVNATPEIAVSVGIEPLAFKDIVIGPDDIYLENMEIDNSLKYNILTSGIVISVKGAKSDLDALTAANVSPSADVGKLGEGTHKVPVKVKLPGSVRTMKETEIEVSIEKR